MGAKTWVGGKGVLVIKNTRSALNSAATPRRRQMLPDGCSSTSDPDNVIRNLDGSAPPKVVFLLSGSRYLIAAAGTAAPGEGSSMGVGPEVRRYALPANPAETNFLTRLIAERPAMPAAAPAPARITAP